MNDIIQYKEELIDIELNNINKQNKGFIEYNCYTIMLKILIDCLENKTILNEEQQNNVVNFIEKIKNENN